MSQRSAAVTSPKRLDHVLQTGIDAGIQVTIPSLAQIKLGEDNVAPDEVMRVDVNTKPREQPSPCETPAPYNPFYPNSLLPSTPTIPLNPNHGLIKNNELGEDEYRPLNQREKLYANSRSLKPDTKFMYYDNDHWWKLHYTSYKDLLPLQLTIGSPKSNKNIPVNSLSGIIDFDTSEFTSHGYLYVKRFASYNGDVYDYGWSIFGGSYVKSATTTVETALNLRNLALDKNIIEARDVAGKFNGKQFANLHVPREKKYVESLGDTIINFVHLWDQNSHFSSMSRTFGPGTRMFSFSTEDFKNIKMNWSSGITGRMNLDSIEYEKKGLFLKFDCNKKVVTERFNDKIRTYYWRDPSKAPIVARGNTETSYKQSNWSAPNAEKIASNLTSGGQLNHLIATWLAIAGASAGVTGGVVLVVKNPRLCIGAAVAVTVAVAATPIIVATAEAASTLAALAVLYKIMPFGGYTWHVGPRGGVYRYTASGNRVYR